VTRLYGDPNPAFTGTVIGFKNGETVGTATTGAMAFSSPATATSNVGGHAIDGSGLIANNGNYVFVQAAGNATALTINPATLTYTADPTSRLYGDPNPAFTGTVTGFKNGETVGTATTGTMAFTSPAGNFANVGAHAINGSGLVANNGNYVFVQDLGNAAALTINPSTLTYVADPKTRLYGDANPALTGSVTGFKNGETIVTATTGTLAFTTSADNLSTVGTYAIDGAGLSANNGNYVFVQAAGNATALTINPATLTYVADQKTRLYGDANPALTGTVAGFKNGETIATTTTGAIVFTTAATAGSNVGTYAIDGSGLTLTNANYVLVQAAGNATALHVNPSTLTYIADPVARLYGDPNPAFTGTVTGFKNGDTQGSATSGALAFTSPAVQFSFPGSYAIDGSGLAALNGNYVFVQDPSNATALTINSNGAVLPNLTQVLKESDLSGDGAFDPNEGDPSAKPNTLDFVGPGTVGAAETLPKLDDPGVKACILGATNAAPPGACERSSAPK
jgi:type IV secretory pathway protease TraF